MIELNGKKYRLVVYDTNFMSDTVKDPRGFGRAALDRPGVAADSDLLFSASGDRGVRHALENRRPDLTS